MPKNDKHQSPCCWAIIPAAGISQRMGMAVPKQYLRLQDSTVLEASLSCFLQHQKIAGVVVALHPKDQVWPKLNISTDKSIHTVVGGESRAQSVYFALNKVLEMSASNDFVLVHDAARPCLCYTDLDLLIQKLQLDDVGGILATPIIDTIKQANQRRTNSNIEVSKTIDRTHLWKALTPQMFRITVLKKALNYCFENNIEVTDEASAVEALGLNVKLIEGRSDNIKITRPEDINLAESIAKYLNQPF